MMRAAILFSALLIAAPANGQPPGLRRDGTDFFRAAMKEAGCKALSSVDDLKTSARDKVLIVFGDMFPVEGMLASGDLQRFLDGGGSVCIATDHKTSDAFFEATGVRVSGAFVSCHRSEAYRPDLVDCPLIMDHLRDVARHAIFSSVPRPSTVATNKPSYITQNDITKRRFDLKLPVAWLPVKGIRRTRDGDREAQLVLAVANSANSRHLLVIADHSIFINDMMSQSDNDNIEFAYGIVRWLTDNGRRKEVLFIDDGQVQTEFNVPLDIPPPKVPPLEALIPLADEALVAVEKDNLINETLLDVVGGPWTIYRTLAFLLTFAILLFGLYRFVQARHRPEARSANSAPTVLGHLTAVERRHRAVIEQGNLAEAARELAHQTFAAVGINVVAGSQPPVLTVPDRLPFRRWRMGREVRRLWNLAARGPRRRVSPAGLHRLDADVHRLLDAVAAGRVRLATSHSAI
jgi:hypothetical protein